MMLSSLGAVARSRVIAVSGGNLLTRGGQPRCCSWNVVAAAATTRSHTPSFHPTLGFNFRCLASSSSGSLRRTTSHRQRRDEYNDEEFNSRRRRNNHIRDQEAGSRHSSKNDSRSSNNKPSTSTRKTTKATPVGNRRTQFEDEFHVGRQLSKFRIDADQQRQWQRQVLPYVQRRRRWHLPPQSLSSAPPYEMEALEQIHAKSYYSNILLEIRDVRVPASSHHPSFTRLARHRLHLICYTHADMIDAATRDRVEAWTQESWPDARCIFVDVREHRPISAASNTKKKKKEEEEDEQEEEEENEGDKTTADDDDAGVWDLVYDSLIQHMETKGKGTSSALTVGVANTGKSSLLLALIRTARRRGELPKSQLKAKEVVSSKKKKKKKSKLKKTKPVAVEDKPGKTRVLTEYLLRDTPSKAYFLDVPGLTPPKFFFQERPESWLALGAANLLPPNMTQPELQPLFCEYVLHCLNRDANFGYVSKLQLDSPTNDIDRVLSTLKRKYEDRMDPDKLQLKRCETFLKLLNSGNFGPVILDDLRLPYEVFKFRDHHFAKNNREEY